MKHVLFFCFPSGSARGRHATCAKARLGRLGPLQAFLCCAHLPSGKLVVGTADGHLFLIDDHQRQLEKSVKAHDGFVYAIDAPWKSFGASSSNNTTANKRSRVCLLTGSRDGCVKLWSEDLECLVQFDNKGCGPVRSVALSPCQQRVLVGSQSAASLREFRASDGAACGKALAGSGCAAGELWALAAHPHEQRVAIASDEGALTMWHLEQPNARDARCGATLLAGACRALAYSPDGKLLAAALGGPKVASGGQ